MQQRNERLPLAATETGSRSCPECSRPLEAKTCHRVEIDVCQSCKGAWFDASELSDVLLGPAKRPTAYTSTFDEATLRAAASSAQTCPACERGLLSRVLWGEVSAAKCQSCRGIWISGRNLDLLRSQLADAANGFPSIAAGTSTPAWQIGADILLFIAEILV